MITVTRYEVGKNKPINHEVTPKQKAADMIHNAIAKGLDIFYLDANEPGLEHITNREHKLLLKQKGDYLVRINKILDAGLKGIPHQRPCEKCGKATYQAVKVWDRLAAWCGC